MKVGAEPPPHIFTQRSRPVLVFLGDAIDFEGTPGKLAAPYGLGAALPAGDTSAVNLIYQQYQSLLAKSVIWEAAGLSWTTPDITELPLLPLR